MLQGQPDYRLHIQARPNPPVGRSCSLRRFVLALESFWTIFSYPCLVLNDCKEGLDSESSWIRASSFAVWRREMLESFRQDLDLGLARSSLLLLYGSTGAFLVKELPEFSDAPCHARLVCAVFRSDEARISFIRVPPRGVGSRKLAELESAEAALDSCIKYCL